MIKNSLTEFEKNALDLIKKIPKGKVTTYQEIAKAMKKPRAMRAVGNALHKNLFAPTIPCHRVVKSNGNTGGYAKGVKQKIKILGKEGIRIKNNKIVDFERKLYKFKY